MSKRIELEVGVSGIDKINQEINLLENNLLELQEELKSVNTGSAAFNQISTAINKTEQELNQLKETLSETSGEQMTLNQQIGEAEDKLYLMAQAGDTSSEAYKKLLSEVGNMKRIQIETTQQIDRAALSMTGKLVVGLQRVATGYQVGMAATQIFGVESEKAAQVMARLQAVMAFTQGIDQLKQLTTGMTLFGRAGIGALSGIQKAIIATGIGALVVAVGLLVAYWDDIAGLVSGISPELEKQNEIAAQNVSIEEDKLKALNSQDNILKLQGKSEKEILELKMNQTKEIIEAQKIRIKGLEQTAELEIQAAERNQDITQKLIRFGLEASAMALRALAAPIDLLLEAANSVSEILGLGELTSFRINDAITDMIEGASEWGASLLFDADEVRSKNAEVIKAEQDKLLELENSYAGFQLQIREMDKKASDDSLSELEKRKAAELSKILQSYQDEEELTDALETERISKLEGISRERAEIEDQYNKTRRALISEATAGEIELLNEQFTKGLLSEEEYRNQRESIMVNAQSKFNEKQLELDRINSERRDAALQSLNEKYKAESEKLLDDILLTQQEKEIKSIDDNYKEKLKKLDELHKAGFIAEEKYQEALAALTKEKTDKITEIVKKSTDEQNKIRFEKTQAGLDAIGAALTQFGSILSGGFNTIFSSLTTSIKGVLSQIKDNVKLDGEGIATLVSGIVSGVVGSISGILSILNEEQQRNLEITKERINESYNLELTELNNALQQGLLSEQEYNKKKFEIDLKKFNEEEKIKRQAFENDKGMRIGQAIMSGAQGAVAAFAGAMQLGPIIGPPVGAALALAVGALTALQVGIISSQQYKGGTAPTAPTAGGLGVNVPLPAAAPVPAGTTLFGSAMTGGNEGGQNQETGGRQEVVRAYVVESDITNAQNTLQTYEQRSEIG